MEINLEIFQFNFIVSNWEFGVCFFLLFWNFSLFLISRDLPLACNKQGDNIKR